MSRLTGWLRSPPSLPLLLGLVVALPAAGAVHVLITSAGVRVEPPSGIAWHPAADPPPEAPAAPFAEAEAAEFRSADLDQAAGVERFGDVEVDFERAEVRLSGAPVVMTALELRLLKAFLSRRGRVLSRAQIIELAWDSGTHVTDRVVDTHILHLRQKIEPVPAEPRYLRGVRGIGYRFDG
jgi:hypothetical protein